MTHFDDDRPTSVPCPACEGDGLVLTEEGTTHRSVPCSLCKGLRVVTVHVMREWRIAKTVGVRK